MKNVSITKEQEKIIITALFRYEMDLKQAIERRSLSKDQIKKSKLNLSRTITTLSLFGEEEEE